MDNHVGEYPEYRNGRAKVDVHRGVGSAVVENTLFVVTTCLFFIFCVILIEQLRWSATLVVYLVALWLVLSCFALPRLHRIFTSVYVPNYFIGRTRTTSGLLGDPVNLAFRAKQGTGGDRGKSTGRDELVALMEGAGWTRSDPVTLRSSVKIIVSSVLRRSYASAPVSPLLLFGLPQAFSFQREVSGNPSQRHHVRFWPCPEGWLLPGGERVDWLAAATYDKSVGISLFTLQVTHKIDADIDIEREYVVATLRYQWPGLRISDLPNFSTGYHSRNGGGDRITTDGNLPVVEIPGATEKDRSGHELAGYRSGEADGSSLTRSIEAPEDWRRRPVSVFSSLVCSMAVLLLAVADQLVQLSASRADIASAIDDASWTTAVVWAFVAATALFHALLCALVFGAYLGSRLSRWLALAAITVSVLGQLIQYLGGDVPGPLAMASISLGLLILFALTSETARDWTRSSSEGPRTVNRA